MEKQKKDKDVINRHLTVKGSLGLLAIGDKGLRAWRELKKEANKSKK